MHISQWATMVTLVGSLALGLMPFSAWGFGKTTLSGFVDTSFLYQSLSETNTFSLNQVELDVTGTLKPWAGFRADLSFDAASSDNRDPDSIGAEGPFDDLSAEEVLEQGYITLELPTKSLGIKATFRFGKLADDEPIGWEATDPPNLYQFSFALVSDFGYPSSMTGAFLALTLHPAVSLELYVINGWDNLEDNNTMKTFGGRLELTPVKGLSWGLNILSGPEQDDNNDNYRTLFDSDITVTLIPRLVIGAQFLYGHEDNVPDIDGRDAKWIGGFVTVNYRFTDLFALTLRSDVFGDKNGSRLNNDNPAVISQTQYALTMAPIFYLSEGIKVLVEFRYDRSNEDVFKTSNGSFADDFFSVAVEFTYSFAHILPKS